MRLKEYFSGICIARNIEIEKSQSYRTLGYSRVFIVQKNLGKKNATYSNKHLYKEILLIIGHFKNGRNEHLKNDQIDS